MNRELSLTGYPFVLNDGICWIWPCLDYQDPYEPSSRSEGVSPPLPEKKTGFLGKIFGDTALRHPIEQRIENRRRGVTRQLRPFLCWILSAVMIGVLIYELVYNQEQQHSPISLKVRCSAVHNFVK